MQRFEQRIKLNEQEAKAAQALAEATGLHIAAAQVLCARGIGTAEQAQRFLHPDTAQLCDPMLLPDMRGGADRIARAIRNGEKIAVFCDYDADGTTGGCALWLHLKSTGADAVILTPNRHKEGYGLSIAAVDEISSAGCGLIVTVDCGITNIEETAYAKSLGIDVIITDHHECGPELPDSDYIINPKREGSEYPCPFIAGCGVAFKLIHALAGLDEAMKYIDLVAVGTITDIVPLMDENRAIAYLGIEKMRKNPCPGIAALARAAGISLQGISSYGVSFGLGPRINAAGRMDTAHLAIDILGASQPSAALDAAAEELCSLNDRRKQEVDDITQAAERAVFKNEYMRDSAILLADEGWNTGVIGIAAARIAEKFVRPCVLFGGAEGRLVGSARSIAGIDIYEALAEFADRYDKFGGHTQAAGLTIDPAILDELRRDINDYITGNYDEDVFDRRSEYDLELGVGDLSEKLVRDIGTLEPFGHGNEKPVIAVMGADIADPKYVGKGTQPHLKFVMRQGGAGVDAVRFFFKQARSFVSERCDFLGEADINDYNRKPQMIVRAMALHYDARLVDGFLAANRERMARQLVDEVICLNSGADAAGESDIEARISKALEASRFGLCIAVPTEPALRWLLVLEAVDRALREGRLVFFDEKAYSAGNCIAAGPAAGHDRMIGVRAGAIGDAGLRRVTAHYARGCFMDRDALLQTYARLGPALGSSEKTLAQMAKALGLPMEKAAFALHVFADLDLIALRKSGKISAIKTGGDRKDLKESEAYRAFERTMGTDPEQG